MDMGMAKYYLIRFKIIFRSKVLLTENQANEQINKYIILKF